MNVSGGQTYQSREVWKQIEAEVSKLPMMGSHNIPILLCGAYLLTILVVIPNFMKDRKPFELKRTIIIYNLIQVFFSIFLTYKSSTIGIHGYDLISNVCHHRQTFDLVPHVHRAHTLWWFLFAKVIEFMDTIFFALRKKDNQITFLHLYHHVSSFTISWYFLKYAPEEYSIMVMFLNSVVHIIMYSYYAISAMGPEYQKYLWWKKYITTIQIVQFFILVGYFSLAKYSNCGYSSTGINILILNKFILICFFYSFYKTSYKPKTS